jgi:hypothetical protein
VTLVLEKPFVHEGLQRGPDGIACDFKCRRNFCLSKLYARSNLSVEYERTQRLCEFFNRRKPLERRFRSGPGRI